MADLNQADFVKAVAQDVIYASRDAGRTITDAAETIQEKLDPLIYSTLLIADGPLEWVEPHDGEPAYQRRASRVVTWKEAYEIEAERARKDRARLYAFETFVRDLDRCPHGRHEGDDCSWTGGCGGPSMGNMWMQDLLESEGSTDDREASLPRLGLGHSLDGYWSYFLRRPPQRGDLPVARLHVKKDGDKRELVITELGDDG